MKNTLLLVVMAFNVLTSTGQKNSVQINFNKNIEFLGYIIELGDPSGNDPEHPISKIINSHPENRNNQLLADLFSLAATMDYSTLTNIMYYLPELPLSESYEYPVEIANKLGFVSEEKLLTLQSLIKKINKLYTESNFEHIWDDLKTYREKAKALLIQSSSNISSSIINMETWYGSNFENYEIVPSLTLWSAGWGINDKAKNKAVFILGPLTRNYDFSDSEEFINLTIHEFGHSFVNATILENKSQLNRTTTLFTPIASDMANQGYTNWETSIIEHFIRAGEIIIRDLMEHTSESERLLIYYKETRKFIYLSFIIDTLKKYRLDYHLSYTDAVKNTLSDLEEEFIN